MARRRSRAGSHFGMGWIRGPRRPQGPDSATTTLARAASARYDGGRRIVFLDCVRGVAASLVVVEHFLGVPSQAGGGIHTIAGGRWSLEYLSPGRVGVVAFFLVSGYVIPLSLERQSQRTFWIRRFFRLYPVYWLAVVAYVIIDRTSLLDAGSLSPRLVVLNLLMVQGAIGAVSILPPGWTLGIELVFYVQSAWAVTRGWLKRAVNFGWFWLAVFTVLAVGSRVSGRDCHPGLPLLLYTAALGHSLYLRDSIGSQRWRWLFAAGALVVPVGAVLSQGQKPAASGGWQPLAWGLSWAVGVALFGLFYGLRDRHFSRALTWVGSISYSLYLTHPTVFIAAGSLSTRHSLTVVWAGLAALPVAWVLHVTVERPAISAGRRLAKRGRLTPRAEVDTQAAP